jgi:hypothetical protein
MAALPDETAEAARARPAPERREDPRIRLAQLGRLHDEAAETAILANLLGRAPQVLVALAAASLAVAALSYNSMPVAEIAVWLALTAAGLAALWRAYARAIAAPFELAALKAFAGDLSAVLFYAGFAWGAGAFLALPALGDVTSVVLFAAVPCALVAALLRSPQQSLLFVAPVAGLVALAAFLRPLGGLEAMVLTLAACAAITGVSHWVQRISGQVPASASILLPAR